MRSVIEVTLVGGESTALNVFLALAGPLLIASAAITAAVIARKTANERQQEQLAHDTLRQERALAHDREMRDRDFLRQTVSSALENAIQATESISELHAKVSKISERRRAAGAFAEDDKSEEHAAAWKALNDAMDEVPHAIEEANRALVASYTDNVRLRALLGEENSVVKTHLRLAHAYQGWYKEQTAILSDPTQQQAESDSSDGDEIATLLKGFERACREKFTEIQ